ncbi:MAG: FlgD immunoglobulin-like domain containing protein, partial [Planctomycetota bacterium]
MDATAGRTTGMRVLIALAAAGAVVSCDLARPRRGTRQRGAPAGDPGLESGAEDSREPEPPEAPPPEPQWTAADFFEVSGPVSPRVAYAVKRANGSLAVALEIESLSGDGSDVSAEMGLAAAKRVTLSTKDAEAEAGTGGARRFSFVVPGSELVDGDVDWARLRMAVAARWSGGPLGKDRQRGRYRHVDGRATHAALSEDPTAWMPLDLAELAAVVADRASAITIAVDQPVDGKMSVVIEDETGWRVRNLVSGVKVARDRREVEWDGLTDDGNLVKPGTYRWRSVHHPGITPEYLFSFANGDEDSLRPFGPNHNIFEHATATAKYAFLAAPSTEGGNALIAVDDGGKLVRGYKKA